MTAARATKRLTFAPRCAKKGKQKGNDMTWLTRYPDHLRAALELAAQPTRAEWQERAITRHLLFLAGLAPNKHEAMCDLIASMR